MTDATVQREMPLPRTVPFLLSFVAGYVDSYTYLALFGLFAAQVTGSFVIAGAEFVTRDYGIAGKLLAIVAFVAARLYWRLSDSPPAPEKSPLGAWGEWAGKTVHYLIYALLIAVPIAGVLAQFARGHGLPIFGLFEIASPWVEDRNFARNVTEVHEVLSNILIALVGLHAIAALVHHYIFRDRTLLRMLPGRRA